MIGKSVREAVEQYNKDVSVYPFRLTMQGNTKVKGVQ
jgi:hypothetical protein